MILRGIIVLFWAIIIFFSDVSYAYFEDLTLSEGYAKGYAITAEPLGLESLLKNPAGLSQIQRSVFRTSYANQFETLVQNLGVGIGFRPMKHLRMGAYIPATIIQNIIRSQNAGGRGLASGTFSNYESAYILGMSLSIFSDHLHLGSSFQIYNHSLDNTSGQGNGLDAGVLFTSRYFNIGASIQNIGNTKVSWKNRSHFDTYKEQHNIGIAIKLPQGLILLTDASIIENSETIINTGAQFSINPKLDLVGGLRDINNDTPSWRMGTILKLNRLNIEYTFSNIEDLGTIHKIGVQIGY